MRVGLTSRPLAGAALVLALGIQVFAQGSASIVMRSGERRPAQNIGFFDGSQLIVRTSFEEEPRFPIGQIAYIDFGGRLDTPIAFNGAQHAIVMRDGRVLQGQVMRIEHTSQDQRSPYLISFRPTNGPEQRLNGTDVSRVYFNEPTQTGVATPVDRGNERDNERGNERRDGRRFDPNGGRNRRDEAQVITVSARQRWTATGINVNRGEQLSLQSSGQVRLNRNGVTASPDGSGGNDRRAPLPNALVGALIGRIGNGQPFGIGSQTSISMPDSGQLFLGVNDSELNDNDGDFRVEIRRTMR